MPVPIIPLQGGSKINRIEFLVDKILEAKNKNSGDDTVYLEKEIDQMVYELYGLTDEEIGLIENNDCWVG